MHISGPISEFRCILNQALAMRCPALHFIFPNHALAVSPDGEYVYMKTRLFVSHTLEISRESMQSMQRFFQHARKQRNKDPKSPFYRVLFDTFKMTEHHIEFDHLEDLTFEMDAPFRVIPHEKAADFLEKVKQLSASSVYPGRPYLKLQAPIINRIYAQFSPFGINTIDRDAHRSLNMFSFTENGLRYERDTTIDQSRLMRDDQLALLFTEDYTLITPHHRRKYPIYDIDILSLRRLIRGKTVGHAFLLPFDRFYIVEGHQGELVYKSHMRYQNGGANMLG